MIDNIRITLENYSGDFGECKLATDGKDYRNYKLYNNKTKNSHALRVSYNLETKKLVIKNSLRKWYLGKYCLSDFTSTTFNEAIQLLADCLNIPIQELNKGKITQTEIGLNVIVQKPVIDFIQNFARYQNLDKKHEYPTTVEFLGEEKKLLIYDKAKEIHDNADKKGDTKIKNAFGVIEKQGKNYLRIEYRLDDKAAFKHHKLEKIQSLGDLACNFSSLYEFWCREISKIKIFNKPKINKKMKSREYLIALAFRTKEYEDFITEYIPSSGNETKDRTERSRKLKEIWDTIDKFGEGSYTLEDFRKDISRKIFQINKKEDNINISRCIHAIWNTKAYRTGSLNNK